MARAFKAAAVIAAVGAWLAVTPRFLQPQDPTQRTILLYDGVCNLCDGVGENSILGLHSSCCLEYSLHNLIQTYQNCALSWNLLDVHRAVHFVADHDPQKNVVMGPIQRHPQLLQDFDAPGDLSTVVVIQDGGFGDACVVISVPLKLQSLYRTGNSAVVVVLRKAKFTPTPQLLFEFLLYSRYVVVPKLVLWLLLSQYARRTKIDCGNASRSQMTFFVSNLCLLMAQAPYYLGSAFVVVPPFIRDFVYNRVAANR